MAAAAAIKVLVKHGSDVHPVSAPPEATVEAFQALVADHVGVPVSGQKLVFKGKSLVPDHAAATLAAVGLRSGSSLLLPAKPGSAI